MYYWLKNNLFRPNVRQCLFCLEPTSNPHLLCDCCENALPANVHHCVICAASLPEIAAPQQVLVCGNCQVKAPAYTTSMIPYRYATPVKQAISALKFHKQMTYAPLLAHIFITALRSRQSKMPECIIPVPLHPKRLQQRGFNQALELVKIIAQHLNIPVYTTFCQRNSNTPFQSGLTAKQRKQNLRNAFEVVKPVPFKHVVIFDDVVTTGTTVNELARKLKLSGVEIIEVWAIARTVDENI